jgi:two-component system response regulator YesN
VYFRRLFERAKNAIKEYLHFTVTVGVGNMYYGIGKIGQSYREAAAAFKNRAVLGGNNIIKYSSLESKLIVTNDLATVRQNMLINMRLGNTAAVKEKLHNTIFLIYEKKHTVESLNLLLSELLVTATSFANDNGVDITEFIGENFNAEAIITEKEDIAEIEKWVEELFIRLIDRVNGSRQTNTARVVDKAKSYIDSNFSKENLDLEGIASNIFINLCYLSNIFKKETGKTVIEYLRECRMEKAKKFMDEGAKNLYTIAEKVGYSDPHYFSKCFKKYYGVSPSKYMESKGHN